MERNVKPLLQGILANDRRSIAKAISLIENDTQGAETLLLELIAYAGRSLVLGITGPPGTGKSTLIARLVEELVARERKVGVVAIDPTSPLTGGAVLGDRVRMMSASVHSNVFIRSMASRGTQKSLSESVEAAIRILEASGKDVVIVETAGTGQADVDVTTVSDLSILVTMPMTGDEIQVLKSGIMEVVDLIVVNKADIVGADQTVKILKSMFAGYKKAPIIITTVATEGKGIDELVNIVENLEKQVQERGKKRVIKALEHTLISMATQEIVKIIKDKLKHDKDVANMFNMTVNGKVTPKQLVQYVLKRVGISQHGNKYLTSHAN